ncbi:HD domain-containing protein [Marinobacter sp. JSM 1782161]|uniref:HD domain-containing protein n=1 Tax=Marinobacter sp. JSM 1782161 TaxID=2685906 RepID=UPI0014029E32|nr:HD domain-containing protein [Marinobacter sp. JSM 1782161]
MSTTTDARAQFTHMKDGTAEDWHTIAASFGDFAQSLPDRIMNHLTLLEGDFGGFQVDRMTHCLQTATLAHRDGKDEEYVVCALLHDIGDTLGTYNHADVAAVLLEPFVSEANHWMVKHHAIFQGYYFFHHLGMDRNLRDNFLDHPHYKRTLEFVSKYDSPAFDPEAETLPLSYFAPMVRRVFAKPRKSLYKAAMEE